MPTFRPRLCPMQHLQVRHLLDRHFMRSDLHDDVHLSRATGAGWR